MQIIVSGQGMSIGASLSQYVEEKTLKYVTKYFDHAISAHIVFHKHHPFFKVDITVNDGTGKHTLLRGEAQCDDVYSAFDMALVKMEKQLRKYKNRIKDHHKSKLNDLIADGVVGTKYVISPFDSEEDATSEASDDNPIIIAEQATNIDKLSVAEAVMKMDLHALPALVFLNKNTDRINVVYHRRDGNISWIDTKQNAS